MKKINCVKVGDIKLVESCFGIYIASIEIDGMNYMTFEEDILDGLKFIMKKKRELCKGKLTDEMFIIKPCLCKLSIGLTKNEYYEIIASAFNRDFVLKVKNKMDCLRILSVLGSKYPKHPIGDFISSCAREAWKSIKNNEI